MITRRAGAVNGGGFFGCVVSFAEQVNDTVVVDITTTGSILSVTDDAGNTFVEAQPLKSGVLTSYKFYALNIPKAGTTIRVNANGFVSTIACVNAFTGVSGIGASGTNTGNSTSPSVSVTTLGNNSVISAGGAVQAVPSNTSWSAMSPNVVLNQDVLVNVGGSGFDSCAALDNGILATPGTYAVSASLNNSGSWLMLGLELRS